MVNVVQMRRNVKSPLRRVYDSDKILSIDWFKKSLRDERSALGKRVIIASRAVLLFTKSGDECIYETRGLLFCDGHQILCTEIVSEGVVQLLVCGICAHAWPSKRIDRGSE